MTDFFHGIPVIQYEGPDSDNEFAFRHYNPDEMIMGKPMKDHLRFAAAYWHSFAWPGGDPFGGQTLERPWFGDTRDYAKFKADVAFEMFQILNVPYFCFHDEDVRPAGATFAQTTKNLEEIVDYFAQKMDDTGVKLLWGTANLFSHRRYMAGAATNPDPDVCAYSAPTIKTCMDVCAAGLKAAAAMLEDGKLEAARNARYAGWDATGKALMTSDLTSIHDQVLANGTDPKPQSGRQERLENLVNRYL
jgi:xylose isomerase